MASRTSQSQSPKASSNGQRPADHADLPEIVAPEQDLPTEKVVNDALSDDPLDLGKMRISPAKLATVVGVKAAHIRIARPDDQDFFRVHQSPEFCLDTYLLRMKADREFYFVTSALWEDPRVLRELKLYRLYYYVHLSRTLGLWPVQLPDEAGNQNSWHESAMAVAEQAQGEWLRLLSGAGGYTVIPDDSIDDEPVWPAMSFQEVIRVAFRPKTITDLDHPKLKQLRVTTSRVRSSRS